MIGWKKLIPAILCLLIAGAVGEVQGAVSGPVSRELVVIGTAAAGPDQTQAYREALENGLRRAFALARQTVNESAFAGAFDQEKDLVTLQREIGVVDFRVTRYWTENNQFRIELKVWLGDSRTQPPRAGGLSRQPRVVWSRETADRIEALSKYNHNLVVNTRQSLEIINPKTGGLKRRIKTGFKPHLASGDRYLVKNLQYLKVYSLELLNIYSFTDIWAQKLPDLVKYQLIDDVLYVVEQIGIVRAFNWHDGRELWQLPALTQVEMAAGGKDQVLLCFPSGELWAVNHQGQKTWVKKFETPLATPPVAVKEDLFCFLEDGRFQVVAANTGESIAAWDTGISGKLTRADLSVHDDQVYLLYNDAANRGHLRVFHRWTGRLLWSVDWEEAVVPKLIQMPDTVVVGLSGTFEARERLFGLKVWEERAIGRITGIYWNEDDLLIISGNRLYCYQL